MDFPKCKELPLAPKGFGGGRRGDSSHRFSPMVSYTPSADMPGLLPPQPQKFRFREHRGEKAGKQNSMAGTPPVALRIQANVGMILFA